ncbi:MAG TPA: desulfoferrodoxin family protein [Spirochaetota bacterium]|nr:desulfoferrodoxin family protein [Spirochaetota bacterium]HSA15095.1 desulfoferrodoxin family protein [Spirochaetota bacterium]
MGNKSIRFIRFFTVFALVFLCFQTARANKSSVEIIAPSEAALGSTVTVKINVFHNGNNRFHHTDWVYVKNGDREIARWDFKKDNLPENENFSREIQIKIEGPVRLEVKANCNIHGSTGEKTAVINPSKGK